MDGPTTVEAPSPRHSSSADGSAVIDVRSLVKTYGGDTKAVDDISFQVAPGELFGFLGPNGAGKTTTIRILATLLKPTSGTAYVAGFDAVRKPTEVRKRLGLAMQTATLDAFSTARETLELSGRLQRMPSKEVRKRADELLELMSLSHVANKLTGKFSGGMKRRLDLAAALMHQPEVLILDEPTEGLDPQSRTALWEELERINKTGTAMLLTTHYMEEADRLCSRLAIIDNGKIAVEGSPADLKRTIGEDTVVLQFPADGEELERLRGEVGRLLQGMINDESLAPVGGGLSLKVANASSAIPLILRQLDGNGVHIAGLSMAQPSLDDVFLKYTGRSIRQEAADGQITMGWGM